MSRRKAFIRHGLIIQKLRSCPTSLEGVMNYLESQSDIHGEDLTISDRTFERDRKDIRSIYRIDITWNAAIKCYEIVSDHKEPGSKYMLESFDLFNAINISNNVTEVIHFSKKKSSGTEHMYELLGACKNRKEVYFDYTNFHDENRKVEAMPVALKEVDYRWYLIAIDKIKKEKRIFGLDRISDLVVSSRNFSSMNLNIDEMFKNSFGIYQTLGQIPEQIILSFTRIQGKYVLHQPLHPSQNVLIDNEEEFRIELQMCVTHDFLMRLLSYGDQVIVISPSSLVDRIKESLQASLVKYQ